MEKWALARALCQIHHSQFSLPKKSPVNAERKNLESLPVAARTGAAEKPQSSSQTAEI